MTTMAIANRA